MKSVRSTAPRLGSLLLAAALLASCSDPEEDRRTLRDAIAGLPQDTATAPVDRREVEEVDPGLPVDTVLFGIGGDPAQLDSTPEPAEVMPVGSDTASPRLRPGPPLDTAPWIPVRDTLRLSAEWTTDLREGGGGDDGMTVLQSVRSARADGYDRIVFEFRSGRLPGYRVEAVEPPLRQCGSGQVVPLRGDAWLRVRLEPSQAHDDRGRPTVEERSRSLDLPVLRELRLVCDYEGQVEWLLGLAAETPFRVTELRNPARLVVDVRN